MSWFIYLHHLEQLLANLSYKHSLLVLGISFRRSKDILLHHGCNNFLHSLHPVSFTWKTASQKTAKKSAKKELLNPVIKAPVVQKVDSAMIPIQNTKIHSHLQGENVPLDRMLVHRNVTPQQYVAGTQLYTTAELLEGQLVLTWN